MRSFLILFLFLLSTPLYAELFESRYDKARAELVETIRREVVQTRGYLGRSTLSDATIRAMKAVKRHKFIPMVYRMYAYDNRPQPIGHGQTISQPYIVAVMTDLLDLEATDNVLEIGTGSGYQAAVLAKIVASVHTVEIIEALSTSATKRLRELGYDNVTTKHADGYYGWEAHAPYDAIIVTAAAGNIPPPLIRQLAPGGKMIIPVKSKMQVQHLILIEKDAKGKITMRQVLPVRFVPLTGKH